MNIATQALIQVEKKLSNKCVIISKVKKNNLASLNFFKASNFIMFSEDKATWLLKKKIKIN